MSTVYVYKQYRDDLAYGEEAICVFLNRGDAERRLREDVEKHFRMKWEDIPKGLPIESEDTFEPDYVSIAIIGTACEYWIVEEHDVM